MEIATDSEIRYEDANGNIYFVYNHAFWRLDTETQEGSRIASAGVVGELQVYGDYLIYRVGATAASYSLITGENLILHDNVSSIAAWNGVFYYIERRAYSLFRVPLDQPDKQPELLKGGGRYIMALTPEERESVAMVLSVFTEDNRLFFTQCDDELWEFREDGNHVKIG